jgi:hypothetical protein
MIGLLKESKKSHHEKHAIEKQCRSSMAVARPPFMGSCGLFTSKTHHPAWVALGARKDRNSSRPHYECRDIPKVWQSFGHHAPSWGMTWRQQEPLHLVHFAMQSSHPLE